MGVGRWLRHVRALALAEVRGDDEAVRREKRELALLSFDGDADTITFRREGLVWTTRAVRHTITRNLFVHGRHPREDFAAMADWLRARRILVPARPWCVDVGANVGAPTVFFARDMGRRVVAVEPVRENADLLRRNVDVNGFGDQVRIVEAAVASEEGTIEVMRAVHDGDSEIAATGVAGVERQSVRARRLDDIVAGEGVDPGAVAFVWSDTQGFETHVLRSGTSLWRAGVPLFVEVWPAALERHGGVDAFLAEVRTHFRHFIPSRELTAGHALAEPRPVAEFEQFVRGLRKQTDCLLVT